MKTKTVRVSGKNEISPRVETHETEFGFFDKPCADYDPGQIVDGQPENPNAPCAYCGFAKTWHLEFCTGVATNHEQPA